MKKKIISVMLATMMVASLTACGKKNETATTPSTVNKDITAEEYAGTITDNANVYKTMVTLPTYTGIEVSVDKSTLEITDQAISDYIDSILESAATTTTYTENEVTQSGDTITLDYSGKLNGEAFSGGTATDASYTVGSGKFISDLDQGLVGLNIGQEYDIPCTFPETYTTADLAGKAVVFTVKVSKISRAVTPELTDAWVAENATTLGIEATDIASLQSFVKTYLEQQAKSTYDSNKYSSIWEKVKADTNASSYPQEELDSLLSTLKSNVQNEYASMGSAYGVTDYAAYLSTAYGFETEDAFNEYAETYSKDYLLEKMFITIVAADNDITVTADEINSTGNDLASYYSYNDYQEILDTYGNSMNAEVGYEVLYQKVIEFLSDKAVEVEG